MSKAELHIITVEGKNIDVTAQYNPKEVGIEKAATWAQAKTPTGNAPKIEFSAGTNRSMSLELTFDGYETSTDVHAKYVAPLVSMAMVMDENSSSDDQKRPPLVKVKWGTEKFPTFTGVVESVSTKYTMFLPDGTPVRATCSVKLKEATKDGVGFKKSQ
jgi:hypothetical protein